MRCPFCGHEDSQVKDSRPTEDGAAIRRRRQCEGCAARFTTFERIQLRDLVVLKSEDRREPFERDKLLRSVSIACRKRPIDATQIERLVSGIQRQLETQGDGEVPSRRIGAMVMDALKGKKKPGLVIVATDVSPAIGEKIIFSATAHHVPHRTVVTKNDFGAILGKAPRSAISVASGGFVVQLVKAIDRYKNFLGEV